MPPYMSSVKFWIIVLKTIISAFCIHQALHSCLWYPGLWWSCWKKTKSKRVCWCVLQSKLPTLDHEHEVARFSHSQVLGCQWEHELLVDYPCPDSFCFTGKKKKKAQWTFAHRKFVIHALMTSWFSDQQINFVIFMKILKVILSKLRANNQSGYPDYKLRQVFYVVWMQLLSISSWSRQ